MIFMYRYVLPFYAVMSVIAMWLYWRDKRKAKKHRFRVPEAVLLGVGFFGGAFGALVGMNWFRHKTRHWYFWAINLIGLAWQVALAVCPAERFFALFQRVF